MAAMWSPRSRANASRFRLNAPGRHMAMNALAALAAARHLTPAPAAESLARALEGFAPVVGRGARRQIAVPGGTALLLDESYNGNPASMRAALAVLRLQPARRRIAVLGDMLELGDVGPDEHRALAAEVAAAADCLFACGPLMHELFAAVPAAIRVAHTPGLRRAGADPCAGRRARRCHPDQGQPRQPHEAGGQCTRTDARRPPDAVRPRAAAGQPVHPVQPAPLHHLPLGRRLPDRAARQLHPRAAADPLAEVGAAQRPADPRATARNGI